MMISIVISFVVILCHINVSAVEVIQEDSSSCKSNISSQILSLINFYNDLGNINKVNGDPEWLRYDFNELIDNVFNCTSFEYFCIGESDEDCKYGYYESCDDLKYEFWEDIKYTVRASSIGYIDIKCDDNSKTAHVRTTNIYSAVINNNEENLSLNQELKFEFVYNNLENLWKVISFRINAWKIESGDCGKKSTVNHTKQNKQNTKLPHILLMVIDDLGWTDISVHNSEYETPNIDNIISTGIELSNYYVHLDCSPTRSALLTGQYSFKHGLQFILPIPPGSTEHIPFDHPTLPELLKQYGYINHMIGKWHLGYSSWNMTPTGRGFDTFYGFLQGAQDYHNHTLDFGWFSRFGVSQFEYTGYDLFNNQQVVNRDEVTGNYTLDLFYKQFNEIISNYYNNNNNNNNPLFMYMSFQTIHTPITNPPILDPQCNNINDNGRRIYCYQMSYLDNIIGSMIDLYKMNGLWDDTLLILSTDNGGMPNWSLDPNTPPVIVSSGCNMPYRGGKATLFEGGIKAVGAINGGNNIIPNYLRNTKTDKLIHAIDWVPTIIEGLLNKNLPRDSILFDGINYWDKILSDPYNVDNEDRILYIDIEVNGTLSGIIDNTYNNKWKYFQSPRECTIEEPVCMLDIYGYYPCGTQGGYNTNTSETEFLFDLKKDPFETKNLAKKYPILVQKYKNMIRDYIDNKDNRYMQEQNGRFHLKAAPILHDDVWLPWQ